LLFCLGITVLALPLIHIIKRIDTKALPLMRIIKRIDTKALPLIHIIKRIDTKALPLIHIIKRIDTKALPLIRIIKRIDTQALILMIGACILLVLSHYGTTFLLLFCLGITVLALPLIHIIKRIDTKALIPVGLVFITMLIATISWYFVVAPSTGNVVKKFVLQTITFNSVTLDAPRILPQTPVEESEEITERFEQGSRFDNFLKIESRELSVQAALGKTLSYMSIPQKIELVVSWLVVMILSYGMLILIRSKIAPVEYKLLSSSFYFFVVMTVLIPHLSVFYGVARAYFTAQIVIAPCLLLGSDSISKRLKVHRYILPTLALTVLGLATSGILHSWFGIIKLGAT
ncbi:MAG: hypothetical protein QF535_16740, partial [Anaerolineales bacterium]|nr:hypothetical protein [Anaerolineales bacterium]